MLRIESALIALPAVFVQNIGKAQVVQKIGWGESHKDLSVSRPTHHPFDLGVFRFAHMRPVAAHFALFHCNCGTRLVLKASAVRHIVK